MVRLGEVLHFDGVVEHIDNPSSERFVTVRSKCGGAVEREIKDGKTPVSFTGYRIHVGQFIYSRIDARNGAFAIVPDSLDRAVVSKDFPVFHIDNDFIVPEYLMHFFQSGMLQRVIQQHSRGITNRQRIKEEELLSFPIPLPPLPEQRRIVSILDRADAIRAKRRQVLADLDELKRSVFAEMFGDMKADSQVANVVEQMRTGPFGSALHHDEFVDSGIAVLGLDNVVGNEFRWVQRRYITPEKYEQLKRYTVHPGDVLVSIMGTAGRCVVVPDDIPTAINTKHICAMSVDRSVLIPEFLRAVFLWHYQARKYLLSSTRGSIMDGLNMGIIKKMPIPLPPLSLQREFASRVERIDAIRAKVAEALKLDDELFASLQSRAFRGEL